MRGNPFVLLVHEHPEPFDSLKRVLKDMSVDVYSVRTCKEAEHLISQSKPQVVFSESALRDGSWVSLLNLSETANVPLDVIVVGLLPDTKLYTSVMERGAFDFVAPPFEHEPLNFVMRSAGLDVRRRRQAEACVAV